MEKQNGGGSFDSSNTSLGDEKTPEMSLVSCETTEPLVLIRGYRVKKELAPLVAAIFRKHGDIVKGSTFSTWSRWCLLELVCSIYNKLEASNITEMTPLELKGIYCQIRDLQRAKVKVVWLQERLNWISENIETYKAAKAKSVAVLCEKEEAVEACEKEWEEIMAAAKKVQERLEKAKDEKSEALSVVDKINSLSLVQDLL